MPVPTDSVEPGQRVVVGIRPENLHHSDFRPSGVQGELLQAEVTLVEAMGSETYVHLTTQDGQRLIARVDPRVKAREGEQFGVLLDLERAHLFDAESGMRLASATGEVPSGADQEHRSYLAASRAPDSCNHKSAY
jgi:multiple sugar transport system ATP-binding protein